MSRAQPRLSGPAAKIFWLTKCSPQLATPLIYLRHELPFQVARAKPNYITWFLTEGWDSPQRSKHRRPRAMNMRRPGHHRRRGGALERVARGLPNSNARTKPKLSPLVSHTHPRAPATADLGLWTCGDQVITVDAAVRWNASRPGCQAACVDAAAALALPSQYYWATSDWGACTVPCGGGQQLRATSCINSVDGSCASRLHGLGFRV